MVDRDATAIGAPIVVEENQRYPIAKPRGGWVFAVRGG